MNVLKTQKRTELSCAKSLEKLASSIALLFGHSRIKRLTFGTFFCTQKQLLLSARYLCIYSIIFFTDCGGFFNGTVRPHDKQTRGQNWLGGFSFWLVMKQHSLLSLKKNCSHLEMRAKSPLFVRVFQCIVVVWFPGNVGSRIWSENQTRILRVPIKKGVRVPPQD